MTSRRRAMLESLEDRRLLTTTLSLSAEPVPEGSTASIFTVQLSAPVAAPVTALFSTRDGTAVGGIDFASLTDHPVTIPAGQRLL